MTKKYLISASFINFPMYFFKYFLKEARLKPVLTPRRLFGFYGFFLYQRFKHHIILVSYMYSYSITSSKCKYCNYHLVQYSSFSFMLFKFKWYHIWLKVSLCMSHKDRNCRTLNKRPLQMIHRLCNLNAQFKSFKGSEYWF